VLPVLKSEFDIDAVSEAAWPLTGTQNAYAPLFEIIGQASLVLVGEASHGTEEFYTERARITRNLILAHGFNIVAVEADWPDAYLINRYVRGEGDAADPVRALSGFVRFPQWMWRNKVVLEFVRWLRDYNDQLPKSAVKVGFYGLDIYSLSTSIAAVLSYLDKHDPDAAVRARYRYACFDHASEDPQGYGYSATFGLSESCERQVMEQLTELHKNAPRYSERDGRLAADEYFFAEQNAMLVRDAEVYYRAMFSGRIDSWNVRDRHMADTLHALVNHSQRQDRAAKAVVWAHNSHVGDARATEMGRNGEWNLGQLVRERYGKASRLIGLSTYGGTVTAAANWDEAPATRVIRPALAGSYEAVFHQLRIPQFGIGLADDSKESLLHLDRPMLERAIGVIYRPATERISHYFEARLRAQFGAILHFDQTHAVEPLDQAEPPEAGEPETFPSAL
jgi:erythromycin esterase-like protein